MRSMMTVGFTALVLAAGLACGAVAQPAAPAAAQAPRPWADKTWIHPDGTRFHYVEMGQGTPVILIHGYMGSGVGNWFLNGIGPALAKTNRVIAIDMRNHGMTTPNPAPAGSMADDVLAFMDAQGIRKAHIGGYSMGGYITGQLMAAAPERFITAHFGGSGLPETPEFQSMIPPDKTGRPEMEVQAAARFNAARAAPAGEQVGNGAGRGSAPASSPAAAAAAAAPPPPRLPSLNSITGSPRNGAALDLTKIDFPVLQVIGEYDNPNRNGHRLWRELKDFRRVVLPDRGHLSAVAPNFIHPAYIAAMTAFISDNNPK